MLRHMRAVMLEVPELLLEVRRGMGIDRKDELWEGVLHMVPPPSRLHQEIAFDLAYVLAGRAAARGLRVAGETGLFASERDYRVPDVVVYDPAQRGERGLEEPPVIVVEVLSPNDESREKLAFYAQRGVGEVWLVDPMMRVAEVYVLAAGTYVRQPERDGRLLAPALELSLETIAGPKLRVRWDGGHADI